MERAKGACAPTHYRGNVNIMAIAHSKVTAQGPDLRPGREVRRKLGDRPRLGTGKMARQEGERVVVRRAGALHRPRMSTGRCSRSGRRCPARDGGDEEAGVRRYPEKSAMRAVDTKRPRTAGVTAAMTRPGRSPPSRRRVVEKGGVGAPLGELAEAQSWRPRGGLLRGSKAPAVATAVEMLLRPQSTSRSRNPRSVSQCAGRTSARGQRSASPTASMPRSGLARRGHLPLGTFDRDSRQAGRHRATVGGPTSQAIDPTGRPLRARAA